MVVCAAAVVAVLRSANAEWVVFARGVRSKGVPTRGRSGVRCGALRRAVAPVGQKQSPAVPARAAGGAGDLPAGRQRLQHADVTAGYLDISATLKFPEDAIDHVA